MFRISENEGFPSTRIKGACMRTFFELFYSNLSYKFECILCFDNLYCWYNLCLSIYGANLSKLRSFVTKHQIKRDTEKLDGKKWRLKTIIYEYSLGNQFLPTRRKGSCLQRHDNPLSQYYVRHSAPVSEKIVRYNTEVRIFTRNCYKNFKIGGNRYLFFFFHSFFLLLLFSFTTSVFPVINAEDERAFKLRGGIR